MILIPLAFRLSLNNMDSKKQMRKLALPSFFGMFVLWLFEQVFLFFSDNCHFQFTTRCQLFGFQNKYSISSYFQEPFEIYMLYNLERKLLQV